LSSTFWNGIQNESWFSLEISQAKALVIFLCSHNESFNPTLGIAPSQKRKKLKRRGFGFLPSGLHPLSGSEQKSPFYPLTGRAGMGAA
jgi:hypothetical protein